MVQSVKVQSIVLKNNAIRSGIVNCRGTETRKRIVNEYKVKPVAHIKLLANQMKHSDAGATIEDEYYIFKAIRNSDGQEEIIQCGMGAARDFLQMIDHPGLPLFNPLKGEHITSSSDSKGTNSRKKTDAWNATAKQLYNAIMWLIIAWDAKPDTPLFDFKDEIEKYKRYEPYDSKIKRVNTVIKNGGKGKTLTEIIHDFSKDNNIKDSICDFKLLSDKVESITDDKGNKLKSFF